MKKIIIALLVILGISSIAHALVLPQATRCIFIDLYDFDREDQVYFSKNTGDEKRQKIHSLITIAKERVSEFWGDQRADPKFIYCDTEEDYLKFGSPYATPAAAIMHMGSYVVINKSGVDLDIISHELSHVELFDRIGLINRSLKIPVWFDEGLAMQVDHRHYYSIDTLRILSRDFKDLPEVKKMNDYAAFGSGTREEVMMNYRTAKYEVAQWYTSEKLDQFIVNINDGKSFEEAY